MKTFLDQDEKQILYAIGKQNLALDIPEYLDKDEVNEVMEDAIILWQSDNEHNFCVLCVWPDKDHPFESMFYFSRFFNIRRQDTCKP